MPFRRFVKRVLGSPDTLRDGLSMIRDTGDMLYYTDEEKAIAVQKAEERVEKFTIAWIETSKGQNVARRVLAFGAVSLWGFMYILSAVFDIVGVFTLDPENYEYYESHASMWTMASDSIGGYALEMNGVVMLVFGFYFAIRSVDKIVDNFLQTKAKDV